MRNGQSEESDWWCNRWIDIGPYRVNSLWHCFGVEREVVDLATAVEMLEASRTALLPINTHRLRSGPTPENLVVGHGEVTLERLSRATDVTSMVPCLNINLQTTAAAAVELAITARELSGISLLKLEVLTADLKRSADCEVIKAVDALNAKGGFTIMPLISADLGVATELVRGLGVPLLRVMGSPIGSGRGIADKSAIEAIAALGVPVIVDGGIGSVDDFLDGMRHRASGGLINSLLFRSNRPAEAMRRFVAGLRSARFVPPVAPAS